MDYVRAGSPVRRRAGPARRRHLRCGRSVVEPMTWEKTHTRATCRPPIFGAMFAPAGAIWRCDECGKRSVVTKTRQADGTIRSGWRTL
jgi:hypothetical protein